MDIEWLSRLVSTPLSRPAETFPLSKSHYKNYYCNARIPLNLRTQKSSFAVTIDSVGMQPNYGIVGS